MMMIDDDDEELVFNVSLLSHSTANPKKANSLFPQRRLCPMLNLGTIFT
jgi:hypothetical protein